MTTGNKPPIKRWRLIGAYSIGMDLDCCRTIVRQCVVKFRLFRQPVHLFEIIFKKCQHLLIWYLKTIEVDPLFSIVGPQPDNITLISGNITDLKLLEKTLNRRIGLCYILPGFNGNGQVPINTKIPAENGVGNMIRGPIL